MLNSHRSLARAILQTLAYSDHFHFPLTLPELKLRLIGEVATRSQLSTALDVLVRRGQVTHQGKYYFLPQKIDLISRRRTRADSSQVLLIRAKQLAKLLAQCPGVLALYITGSLAVTNADQEADIDLMVITKPGRLWTTRLLLTLYTSLLALRRTPTARSISGKLCLNLYLTPTSYTLPESRRSLYTAYELIQAQPLYDPHSTRAALLSANAWLSTYLPNYPLPKSSTHPKYKIQYTIYETIAFTLQYQYMKSKITREYITPDAAFFHPRDPWKTVINAVIHQRSI